MNIHNTIIKRSALSDLFDGDAVDDSIGETKLSSRVVSSSFEKRKGVRVHREANLRGIFPTSLDLKTVYLFMSTGDIDQLSYPTVIIEKFGVFDTFYCSTWTMTHLDVGVIASWADSGLIREPCFAVGEYFAKRETAAYATLVAIISRTRGRVRCFANHAKIVLLGSAARDEWIVITGSSNLSMNPRSEQTTIFNDKEIYDFYRDWFESLFVGNK